VALQADAAVLPELLALHDRLFPATYLHGDALPASLDTDHQLFAAVAGGRLGGYVYVQHRRDEHEGYVDYLGVAEHARGQGLGRALLLHALQWALVDRGLPCVHLTVRHDSAPALGLYRSAGFREVAAGLQLCLERG
jgi:ribosomal protein S18 acetylase RimI-like enzyme